MASYVGVRPSEESWDDYGDAQTEMSVAPARPRGGVEAHSGRGPAARSGPTGGYTEEELAALAAQEDDDWGAPPAPRNPPYGASNPHRGGYAGSGYGAVLPPAPAQQGPPLGVGEHPCPKCSAACVQRTSNTPKNPGRQFVKCPNEGCGYFKWTDELGADGPAPAGGAGYGGYGGDAGHGSPSAKRRITGYTGAQGGSQGGYKAGYGYGGGEAPPPVPGSNTLQAAADGGVLRDRSNDTCYKCNGTGHWASNCPNQQVGAGGGAYDSAGGGGGAKSGSCFKCGQDGHWSRDCPNQGGGGSGNYGGGGGGYAGSRYKADGGADGAGYGAGGGAPMAAAAGGAKSGSCFKCGQDGHWSRDCPNQGGGGGGDGGYGGGGGGYGGGGGAYGGGRGAGYGGGGGGAKSGSCFKCGQDGHWSRDCPNQGGGGGGGYGGGGYGGGGAAGGKRKYGGGY